MHRVIKIKIQSSYIILAAEICYEINEIESFVYKFNVCEKVYKANPSPNKDILINARCVYVEEILF